MNPAYVLARGVALPPHLSASASAASAASSSDASAAAARTDAAPMDMSEALQEPALFGRASQLLGDLAYPSANPVQWLSDTHLANGHAADARPVGGVRVRYNYPRAQVQVPSIFAQRPARRVIERKDSVLIQQFCDGVHWHNLALMGPECTAYYWEPKGTPLNRRSPIHSAFCFAVPAARIALEDAAPGWHFECILLELQADGHSCGDWAHYFRCRVLEYAADDALLGSRTFAAFLLSGIPGMTNLRGLSGTRRTQAAGQQRRIARRRRDELRALLRVAAQQNKLPWGSVQLEDFMDRRARDAHEVVDLLALDESDDDEEEADTEAE